MKWCIFLVVIVGLWFDGLCICFCWRRWWRLDWFVVLLVFVWLWLVFLCGFVFNVLRNFVSLLIDYNFIFMFWVWSKMFVLCDFCGLVFCFGIGIFWFVLNISFFFIGGVFVIWFNRDGFIVFGCLELWDLVVFFWLWVEFFLVWGIGWVVIMWVILIEKNFFLCCFKWYVSFLGLIDLSFKYYYL